MRDRGPHIPVAELPPARFKTRFGFFLPEYLARGNARYHLLAKASNEATDDGFTTITYVSIDRTIIVMVYYNE